MIRIFIGKPGSGKTLSAVKEMFLNSDMKYISNIQTKKLKNNILIKRENLIKSTPIIKNKKGDVIFKEEFNKQYWINLKKDNPEQMINIILDEIHSIYDARRSTSTKSKIINDFIALIRKILSDNDSSYGTFTMITQLDRRIDIIGIEMANQIRYHICYYQKTCLKCNYTWDESNEQHWIEQRCPLCGNLKLKKHSFFIHIYFFDSLPAFFKWKELGYKTFFKHTIMPDPEFYFDKFNTFQWDDLL